MGCTGGKKERKGVDFKVARSPKASKRKLLEAKIVLLGDTGVGKSSIVARFSRDKFLDTHEVTIGSAYFQHRFLLPNGVFVKLHIWDTGGAERFRSMTHIYYKNSLGAILVYDITQSNSLDVVKYWMKDLETHEDPKRMVLALVANKCDQVPIDLMIKPLGKRYAEDNGMIFRETSALTGQGIQDLFQIVIDAIIAKFTN